MKNMIKDAVILFVITLFAGLALGLVYQVTKEPIAQQEIKAKNRACAEVFADASSFEPYAGFDAEQAKGVLTQAGLTEQDIEEVSEAKDDGGNVLGYVITVVSHDGYGGDIKFSMGVTLDGVLNGISILSISETAGLGMKADTDAFKEQWKSKKVEKFSYTKTGAASDDQIDAISGATVTTNAMTNGVNAGLAYYQSLSGDDAAFAEGGAVNE